MKNKLILCMCLLLSLTGCAPHHHSAQYYYGEEAQHRHYITEQHSTQKQVERYVGGTLYGIPLGMGILVIALMAAGG